MLWYVAKVEVNQQVNILHPEAVLFVLSQRGYSLEGSQVMKVLAPYGGFKWRNIKRLKRNVFFIASTKSYFSDGISCTHISVEVALDNQAIGQFF